MTATIAPFVRPRWREAVGIVLSGDATIPDEFKSMQPDKAKIAVALAAKRKVPGVTVTPIPKGRHLGTRDGPPPEDEREHFMRCEICGGWVDCRDLGDVFAHIEAEHEKPVGDA